MNAQGEPLGSRLPKIPMVDGDMRRFVELYGYYPAPPTSGNAYSRSVLERLLPLDEDTWKRGPDGPLNALSALYGTVVSIHRSLGCYRIHGRNMYAGVVTVPALRASLRNELDREVAIREHLRALGRAVPAKLCLHIPSHVKARLVSLRLDPANHPTPGDSVGRLTLAGIISAWAFPHFGSWRQVMESLVFVLVALAPRAVLSRILGPLFRGPAERRVFGLYAASRRRKFFRRRITALP